MNDSKNQAKFAMAGQFCTHELEELSQLIRLHGTFLLIFCVFYFIFSSIAVLGNLLVIRAIWKTSSMPSNMKKLFLSLTFSDLAVGMFAQFIYGVIIAVMLRMAENGNFIFEILCPAILNAASFSSYLLASASFLAITTIAVDRFLAISLHLRYQELVTPNRVISVLMSLWFTSAIIASMMISFPQNNILVATITELAGVFLTTVAYIRIYKVIRHHQNQIQSQLLLQNNAQAMELLREKKSSVNALFVHIVFLACYLPYLCYAILVLTNCIPNSFLPIAEKVSELLVFLNSSLNPFIYCWRYREIREIVKKTVKKIFRSNDTGT